MSVFKFSLQSVLNHRVDVEEEKKSEYQLAIQSLREESEKTQQLIQQIKELDEQLTRKGMVHVNQLHQLLYYREQLQQKLMAQRKIQLEMEKEVEMKQKSLLQAKLDVQVLEKLKEKKYTQYVHYENLEELKQLDELSCINYGRV